MRISDWSSDVGSSDLMQQHALDQMRRDTLQPVRFDRGIGAREQLRGLRELRAHHPLRTFLRKRRARMNLEPAVARPLVLVLLRQLVADMVDQSGRSEEHTFVLQSLMRISYAVFFLKKKTNTL